MGFFKNRMGARAGVLFCFFFPGLFFFVDGVSPSQSFSQSLCIMAEKQVQVSTFVLECSKGRKVAVAVAAAPEDAPYCVPGAFNIVYGALVFHTNPSAKWAGTNPAPVRKWSSHMAATLRNGAIGRMLRRPLALALPLTANLGDPYFLRAFFSRLFKRKVVVCSAVRRTHCLYNPNNCVSVAFNKGTAAGAPAGAAPTMEKIEAPKTFESSAARAAWKASRKAAFEAFNAERRRLREAAKAAAQAEFNARCTAANEFVNSLPKSTFNIVDTANGEPLLTTIPPKTTATATATTAASNTRKARPIIVAADTAADALAASTTPGLLLPVAETGRYVVALVNASGEIVSCAPVTLPEDRVMFVPRRGRAAQRAPSPYKTATTKTHVAFKGVAGAGSGAGAAEGVGSGSTNSAARFKGNANGNTSTTLGRSSAFFLSC